MSLFESPQPYTQCRTVPGLNAAYDVPEGAASGPPSPAAHHRPHHPHSPLHGGSGGPTRLAASSNAFNALLLSQSTHSSTMAAAAAVTASASGTSAASSGGGGGILGGASNGGAYRGSISPLPLRPPPHILASYASSSMSPGTAAAVAAALGRDESYAGGYGALPDRDPVPSSPCSSGVVRLLNPLQAATTRGGTAPTAGFSTRPRASSRARRDFADGGGGSGEEGYDEGPGSLQAIADAYLDPERLRKDREAMELRVTEAVLSTSPLFQRL